MKLFAKLSAIIMSMLAGNIMSILVMLQIPDYNLSKLDKLETILIFVLVCLLIGLSFSLLSILDEPIDKYPEDIMD